MKKITFVLISCVLWACDKKVDPAAPPAPAITEAAVVQQYALIASESYQDAIKGATNLKTQIDAFLKAPSEDGLKACQKAWIDSRPAYLQTEAFRFYGGPIDEDKTNYEGLINSWPLDENTIDYTVDGANPGLILNSGLINDPAQFPTINKELLPANNEKGGEKDVKVGYHAIEFLLWGQDLYADSPGKRPYTDYVTGAKGTAQNQDRRGVYLRVVTDLLIEDLTAVANQWTPNKGAYWTEFTKAGNEKASLQKMFIGMAKLSKGELAGERMTVALGNKDQEDEHSCFSDNTTNDIIYNELGIYNVYLGKYVKSDGTKLDGPGLDDLVKAKDTEANVKQITLFESASVLVRTIPAPFDQALIGDVSREKIKLAITAIRAQADQLVAAAKTLAIDIVAPDSNG